MGTEKLRGIVLREQAKGESNKQIVLLAQGVGRVLLSARGARRAKSKLLAATQLFCYADFVVYEGKGFYSVTQAELKNSFYGLRLDMDKFSEGMYLAELTERSCPAGMEQDAVLELLYYAFLVMDRGILPPKLISRIFELKLLQLGSLRQMYAISAAKARGHSILTAGWVRFTVKSTAQRIAFLFWMPSEGRFGLCWRERAARRLAFSFPPKHSNS